MSIYRPLTQILQFNQSGSGHACFFSFLSLKKKSLRDFILWLNLRTPVQVISETTLAPYPHFFFTASINYFNKPLNKLLFFNKHQQEIAFSFKSTLKQARGVSQRIEMPRPDQTKSQLQFFNFLTQRLILLIALLSN